MLSSAGVHTGKAPGKERAANVCLKRREAGKMLERITENAEYFAIERRLKLESQD